MQDTPTTAPAVLPRARDDIAAVMDGLCALAGPGAAALVAQIGADLTMLAGRIEAAADAATLRRGLHDARALAGTCGARGVGAAADRLRADLAEGLTPGRAECTALAAALRALAAELTAGWPR